MATSTNSSACPKCDDSGALGHSKAALARLTLEAALTVAYCDCETGRLQKAAIERKARIIAEFVKETVEANDRRRAEKLRSTFEEARIPPHYQAWSFRDFKEVLDDGKREAYTVAVEFAKNGGFVVSDGAKKYGFTLHGSQPGIGKTTLASIAFRVCMTSHKMPGLWIEYPRLVRLVQGGYADGSVYEVVKQASNIPLLLLDDFGKQAREGVTPSALDAITDILSERHDWNRPTILTTQKGPAELAELYRKDNFDRIAVLTKVVPIAGAVLRKY